MVALMKTVQTGTGTISMFDANNANIGIGCVTGFRVWGVNPAGNSAALCAASIVLIDSAPGTWELVTGRLQQFELAQLTLVLLSLAFNCKLNQSL